MKDTLRCFISCILPCGALDVIRIVHTDGRVQQISGSHIRVSKIMKAFPGHVLKKPSSPSDDETVPKIVVIPPEAELRRGKIYFLVPLPSTPENILSETVTKNTRNGNQSSSNTASVENLLVSDRYLSERLSEKLSTPRDRRRGRVGVWRPHLEIISETPN